MIILSWATVHIKLDYGLDYGGSNEVQTAEILNKRWRPKEKDN
jgi:hypothetical protein